MGIGGGAGNGDVGGVPSGGGTRDRTVALGREAWRTCGLESSFSHEDLVTSFEAGDGAEPGCGHRGSPWSRRLRWPGLPATWGETGGNGRTSPVLAMPARGSGQHFKTLCFLALLKSEVKV